MEEPRKSHSWVTEVAGVSQKNRICQLCAYVLVYMDVCVPRTIKITLNLVFKWRQQSQHSRNGFLSQTAAEDGTDS